MTWISFHQYGYGINRKLRDTLMHVQTNVSHSHSHVIFGGISLIFDLDILYQNLS
jgi:hypothetical protein